MIPYEEIQWTYRTLHGRKERKEVPGNGGSSSTVYRATLRGEPVAVKVFKASSMRTEDVTAFKREADLQYIRPHENIVPLLGAAIEMEDDEKTPAEYALVMPFMSGGTLETWIFGEVMGGGSVGGSRSPPPLSTKLKVLHEVALAIRHLHSLKVVHADIKPANVLFDGEGRARVCDFGLARVQKPADNLRTTNHGARGTPLYLDPTLRIPLASVSMENDIYSFAIMAWEVVCGRTPFEDVMSVEDDALYALYSHTANGGRPDLSLVPDAAAALRPLLESAWSANVAQRPDAAKIAATIEQLIDGTRVGLRRLPPPDHPHFDVFLSHAWGDEVPKGSRHYPLKEKALDVARALRAAPESVTVWVDKENLAASAAFKTIETACADAILNSHVFVMCVSNAYGVSDMCKFEAELAARNKIPTVVVIVGEDDFSFTKFDWLKTLCGTKLFADVRTPEAANSPVGYAQVLTAVLPVLPALGGGGGRRSGGDAIIAVAANAAAVSSASPAVAESAAPSAHGAVASELCPESPKLKSQTNAPLTPPCEPSTDDVNVPRMLVSALTTPPHLKKINAYSSDGSPDSALSTPDSRRGLRSLQIASGQSIATSPRVIADVLLSVDGGDPIVAEKALITLVDKISHAKGVVGRQAAANAALPRAIVEALVTHAGLNTIAEYGCHSIYVITHGDSSTAGATKRAAIDAGAPRAVVAAIRENWGVPAIAVWAFAALGSIAEDFPAGQQAAVDVDALKVIVEAMRAHASVAAVARNGCDALCEIGALSGGREAAVVADAPRAVIAALSMHAGDEEVAVAGCRALLKIAASPSGLHAIQAAGGAAIVTTAIALHAKAAFSGRRILQRIDEGVLKNS